MLLSGPVKDDAIRPRFIGGELCNPRAGYPADRHIASLIAYLSTLTWSVSQSRSQFVKRSPRMRSYSGTNGVAPIVRSSTKYTRPASADKSFKISQRRLPVAFGAKRVRQYVTHAGAAHIIIKNTLQRPAVMGKLEYDCVTGGAITRECPTRLPGKENRYERSRIPPGCKAIRQRKAQA